MIVYSASKKGFIDDVMKNRIDQKIYSVYQEKIGRTSISEQNSWKNSMMYMSNVLLQSNIPDDVNIAIEYQVPNTGKRVDFIIAGVNEQEEESVIIIELKQWSEVEKTNKDGVVKTFVGGGLRNLTHPSYQAWTYALLIKEYNETVRDENIQLYPCAYLHNYSRSESYNSILDPFYKEYLDKAPSFLRDDSVKLSNFIKKYIKKGDQKDILYRIDNGRIKPSKSLGEQIGSMLDGNKEFFMIEDQKVVYEELKELSEQIGDGQKKTVIIKGGPGTGKSVIAINLLVELINEYQYNAQYVTRNAAPRQVYSALLKGYRTKSFIDNLFKGSGSYIDIENNYFDCLIVDEAHRLNERSGLFYKGENQIKEIINASKLSIFFIDEAQRVTMRDKGSVEEIKYWANINNSAVYEMELSSQFRCNGSDGYLAWLDNLLGIRETANPILDTKEFDFRVFDNPKELRDIIVKKNKINNKSRILAGYCWEWPSDKRDDTNYHDIQIPKYDFSISWNLEKDGLAWIIQEHSINEAGCIHTSQGLELDYVGVIIGDDLRFENGKIITDVTKRADSDQSVRGWKKGFKENRAETEILVDEIIRNTYRTLLTRGMKGCYVYCTDEALSNYIKRQIL